MRDAKARFGGESVLPFCYGGSNGLLTQDTTDARLFRRFGASRLARTLCASATGAASQGLYGKMPSVSYQDYVHARLIVVWGANPSASGIHLVPYIREAQRNGAALVVIDPRSTPLARLADLHLPIRPGTDLAGRARAASPPVRDRPRPTRRSSRRIRRAPTGSASRAQEWTMARAAEVAGVPAADLERLRRSLRRRLAGPDPLRLGPRAQPQRRQRRRRRPRPARRGRQVRRARRRVHDEQLVGLGHQPRPGLTPRSRRRAWST